MGLGSLLLTQYFSPQLVLTACPSLYIQLVPITYTCIWMVPHSACNTTNDVSIFWSKYGGEQTSTEQHLVIMLCGEMSECLVYLFKL